MSDAPPVGAVVAAMLSALELERAELRARLGPLGDKGRVRVQRGRRLVAEPGAHTYRFDCTLDVPVPEGTPVRVDASGEITGGDVLRFDREDESLLVVLKQDLGDVVADAFISFDPSVLLALVADRLRLIAEGATRTPPFEPPFSPALALDLLTGGAPAQPPAALPVPEASPAQAAAVAFAAGQRVAYVWGPPGTGKTRTLALLVRALVQRGEQVLLVAHTNVATDTALRRVLDLGQLGPGAALRLGPYGDALAGQGVGLDEAVDHLLRAERSPLIPRIVAVTLAAAARFPQRAAFLTSDQVPLPKRLRTAITFLEQDEADPEGLAPTLAALDTELTAVEAAVVARARILATTLTRAAIAGFGRTLRPHTVIIDEASTAPLVTAFAAAALATRRVVAVGDFLQLSPICASGAPEAQRWLARHVFTSAGCDRVASDHPLRVLLDQQWRMHPQIAAVVSRAFYAGRLRDARPGDPNRATTALALVDSASSGATSASTSGGSKLNRSHAALVAQLALAAAPQREVAVITPYRAQVRRIRELIRAQAPAWLENGRIEVFSVHRFQGRERSLVIFDTVEAPGTALRFLDDLHNADAPRLVNVALSRAMDQLVIVFHSRHLAALGPAASIVRVLAAARAGGAIELLADDPGDRDRLVQLMGVP